MSLQQQQAQQPVERGRVARWLTPVSASLALVALTTLALVLPGSFGGALPKRLPWDS